MDTKNPRTITTTLQTKAERLLADGKVHHVKGLVYEVEGDHSTYTVTVSYPQEVSGRCTCPSQADICSHLLAAVIDWRTDRELMLEKILREAIHPVQVSGLE